MAARVAGNPKTGPAGTFVRRDHGHTKIVATSGHRWSEAAETLFLDALAASANVTLAAAEAGFSTVAIYRRRRTDAAFAGRWRAALEQGVARLEMALVRAAADSMEGVAFDAERPLPPMTYDQAMNILKLHSAETGRGGRRYGAAAKPRSLDDVRDSILRKVEAIVAARDAA